MKKIVFIINEMATGGVQQSLINLINEIKNYYDVSLVVFYLREEEKARIPSGIKTIVLKSPFKHLGMSKADVKGNTFSFLCHAIWVYMTKIFGRSRIIRIMSLFQNSIKGFDCAISFIHEANQQSLYGGCNEFVIKKIQCRNRITWLHCDFENIGASKKQSEKIYKKFDKIVACSKGCLKSFLHEYPQFQDKCIVIRNCVNYQEIKDRAGEGYQYNNEVFNVISVARLSAEKGLERALEAVAYCIRRGQKIMYHIIGEGDQRKKLIELTKQLGLTTNVRFYGNKDNPYYYMKNADLLLISSYHEAAPMVIDESAVLGVPVLSTKTTSTDEMLEQNQHGFVCENSTEGIKQALYEIINNKQNLESVKKKLSESIFSNNGIIDEVHCIIGQ